MNSLKTYLGLLLVVLGVLTFIVSYACGLTDVNAVQFAGLFLVVGGIIVHVVVLKSRSKY